MSKYRQNLREIEQQDYPEDGLSTWAIWLGTGCIGVGVLVTILFLFTL